MYKPHGNHKPKIIEDTHTKKRKESKHNTKDSHQIISEESKRRRTKKINQLYFNWKTWKKVIAYIVGQKKKNLQKQPQNKE